jgi:dihydropyrimidinase
MSLLIKNGEIVTASERYRADIYCEGETITRIDPDISAPPDATVVDATGKFVFPGFIDPHVHIYLPFMGTYSKDTYETGSKAALVGGTTTLIEMCCPSRQDDTFKGFELWMSQAAGKSACDFTFHMGVTKYDAATSPWLPQRGRGRERIDCRHYAFLYTFSLDAGSFYCMLSVRLHAFSTFVYLPDPAIDFDRRLA